MRRIKAEFASTYSRAQRLISDADYVDLMYCAKAAESYLKGMELAEPVHPDAKRLMKAVKRLRESK